MKTFSKRHGYINKEAEIAIREDAPGGLRRFVVDMAEEDCGLKPSSLRNSTASKELHEALKIYLGDP